MRIARKDSLELWGLLVMRLGSMIIRVAIVAGVVGIISYTRLGILVSLGAASATAAAMALYYRRLSQLENKYAR